MHCPQCGSENADYANFCMACGHAFPKSGSTTRTPYRQWSNASHQRGAASENGSQGKSEPTFFHERAGDRRHAAPERREAAQFHHHDHHHDVFQRHDFDYPRHKSGARRVIMVAAGIALFLLSASAIAVWMNPSLSSQGAELLKAASVAVGLNADGEEAAVPFGTSQGELPYDGKTVVKTTKKPEAKPTAAPSPQSSGGSQDNISASAAGMDTPPADVGKADTLAVTEEPVIVPASDPEKKPSSLAPVRSKQSTTSSELRKKEISRLRRQAARELGID
jgi:hypothetical protein